MTLEDISVLFGDPVELSFEQALSRGHSKEDTAEDLAFDEKKQSKPDHVETKNG